MQHLTNHLKRTPLIAAILFLSTSLSSAAEYTIDPTHSDAIFKVKHMGISTVTGKFDTFSGSFEFDQQNVEISKAAATIATASINTGVEKRDEHLRSADFFDAEKFPQISFVSQEITDVQGNTFRIHGDLTMHGVTQPVVLEAELGGVVKDPWGNERAAFTASTTINRKEFGLTYAQVLETGGLLVGEEVQILLEIEGILKK